MKVLPEKTVERLSEYRRTLLNCLDEGKSFIFSHELAKMHGLTAVQVRRDIMFLGYNASNRKGYDLNQLIKAISCVLDAEKVLNVAVVGIGNYGKAIATYFSGKRPKLNIVCAFDTDTSKISKVYSGLTCYPMDEMETYVRQMNITIAILTVPPQAAVAAANKLVSVGIKGILNFTSVPLNVPEDVYLEDYDMITSLEKVAYFVNQHYNAVLG
jgi:redox-sensing transcriptional repressor